MHDEKAKYRVKPPWIVYPHNETWAGWRQGYSEGWLNDVWLPFWRKLSPEERDAYLQVWPAPDEEWRRYVTELWI